MNYNNWSELSTPFDFSTGKEGNKIIFTTRDEKIALMIGKNNQQIHRLNPISEGDSWSMFKKHALNNSDDTENSGFELIGKEIVKKCGGLPLAIKAVAGLLRSKETIEEWDQSIHQLDILPSLRLSYIYLSPHLKRCCSYCAVFHKGYKFSKNEVTLLWMANNLLDSPQRNKRLKDVGDESIRELKLRSFFQQTSNGEFSMHDLVNDLAKFVSGKYFPRLDNDQKPNSSSIVVRHFSYMCTFLGDDALEKLKPLAQAKFLRTFLPININGIGCLHLDLITNLLWDSFPTSKSLRVLSLNGFSITELPNFLFNLKQLQFLDLSCTEIKKLPCWICTLYNLHPLLAASCRCLEEFPKDMEKLINLRYLDISGISLTKMPLEIGGLENIQYLSTFIVCEDNDTKIEILGKLCNLHGEFTISGLENIQSSEKARMAK